jgi:hypothetical protein
MGYPTIDEVLAALAEFGLAPDSAVEVRSLLQSFHDGAYQEGVDDGFNDGYESGEFDASLYSNGDDNF